MIPLKFKKFLEDILLKSEQGEIKWNFHDDEVFVTDTSYRLNIKFDFDTDRELPFYKIHYSYMDQEVTIIETHEEIDYRLVANIYKSARASKLNFPF